MIEVKYKMKPYTLQVIKSVKLKYINGRKILSDALQILLVRRSGYIEDIFTVSRDSRDEDNLKYAISKCLSKVYKRHHYSFWEKERHSIVTDKIYQLFKDKYNLKN